ncbi:Carboxypeptidase G2 precursor [Roseomonas mucosa]|uniref:Carboxypeptidase G2 n=1 Tax=Roseomonas mucosa TaxID=207340 RepID=A0A1S8DA29_9PROT|nr:MULTISPECIES: M20 family metallopeptidase [Roseomonas]MBS5901414.1 M20 family metallopeptidase [Acetobacteraceae bacterium]AWV23803.1 Carboxypeptidase G2 precursor [Roseomonas mucosa]MCG7351904.1 M20 family metallopeptidase [Roseomonas mucosa]MCG7357760.1 M20 family metallopeptidase [Roseomonas mucosa]MDT8275032.1 M20 family metallopeptidase [Roseomonas mucosa]
MPATEIGTSERLLEELRLWVEMETPTTDAAAVNRLVDRAEAGLREAGATLERIPGRDGYGDNLIARLPGPAGSNRKPVVVCVHLDTVWDNGTLAASMPFRVEGDKAYGPGIYDMKSGSFLAFHAVREILRQKVATRSPVTLIMTPDEEVGSPTSRAIIEREARDASAVLIAEPAGGPQGACVTARKGVGRFVVKIHGISAHAGGNWSEGRSAVVALSELVLKVHGLVDLERGVTTNVAPVWGGTRPNVVPPEAGCEIDLRVASEADGVAMERAILALAGERDGIRIEITGGMNRPPMEETAETLRLYETARELARQAGYDLPKQHRGGGSDGNFTAALGIPTLDGLGCTGAGAHAPHEHILWRDLAARGQVLAGLIETL